MLVVETIANSSGVFFAKDYDQVDLPRFACFAKSGSEGPPVAGDRVPLSAQCPGSWTNAFAWAKAHAHPELSERTIWEVFEEERPKLIPYRGRFDGFHALPASVSKTCLVRFDNTKYSVSASAVGRPVDIHAYADRIVIRQDVRIVGEHRSEPKSST